MGVSTDGIICYGIRLAEDGEFPWGDEELFCGDFEVWIREKAPDHDGRYELVNCCSEDYPMYILCDRPLTKIARRGYPEEITGKSYPALPIVAKGLADFCETHSIPIHEENSSVEWWLCSYWG